MMNPDSVDDYVGCLITNNKHVFFSNLGSNRYVLEILKKKI